jgi:hypothetical protein
MRVVLDRVLADARSELHTCFPATVIAYDVAAQTVDVRPAVMRELGSDDPEEPWAFEELPDLMAVQLMWPRTGSRALTFPLSVGDWVMVLCAEQSLLLWRSRGTAATHPGLNDPHGLNGCVALPGWYPDVEKLTNVSSSDVVLGDLESDATVRIKPDGSVVLGGEAGAGALVLDAALKTFLNGLAGHITAAAAAAPPVTGAHAIAVLQTALTAWLKLYPLGTQKTRAR